MFGLLRAPRGYLTEAEQQVFQGHYCGLCNGLARCGFQGLRLVTSYDATALALFVSGMSGQESVLAYKPCPFSPWRKKPIVINLPEVFDYTARASLGIVKLKAEDELIDSRSRLKSQVMSMLSRYLGSKVPAWPEFFWVSELQREAEQNPDPWFDELAYPSGVLLGSLAARAAEFYRYDRDIAFAVGENLGKWVYVWDCLWDFEDDQAAGRFNALAAAYKLTCTRASLIPPSILAEMAFVMERCLDQVLANLKALQLNAHGELLAKLFRGAHSWHKHSFRQEFFKEENADERLPVSWRETCPHSAGAGQGVGVTNQ